MATALSPRPGLNISEEHTCGIAKANEFSPRMCRAMPTEPALAGYCHVRSNRAPSTVLRFPLDHVSAFLSLIMRASSSPVFIASRSFIHPLSRPSEWPQEQTHLLYIRRPKAWTNGQRNLARTMQVDPETPSSIGADDCCALSFHCGNCTESAVMRYFTWKRLAPASRRV